MNPLIGNIARKYKNATTSQERVAAYDELVDLAGEDVPMAYLLNEIAKGIEGYVSIETPNSLGRPRISVMHSSNMVVRVDGLDMARTTDLNVNASVGDILRSEVKFYPKNVTIDGRTAMRLGMNDELA